uniref:Reverse transcriptase Ty1/copia-type domain-containing protein n=1 Tax=Fagus sylvatica TaxID=28930 RepID=A0A2N9G3G0_FAGSY
MHAPPRAALKLRFFCRSSHAAGTTKLQIYIIQELINKTDTTNQQISDRSTLRHKNRRDPTVDMPPRATKISGPQCFKLYPELRHTFPRKHPPSFNAPHTATIAETHENSAAILDFSRLQAQIGQLQTQLGSLATHTHDTPTAPTATIATGTPTVFLVRTGEPTWVLDSGANDHMTEQNGVAKRKNRHIMSIVRCLLCGMHVPKSYWHMAVLTAIYLMNRTPSWVLHGMAPLQLDIPFYGSTSPLQVSDPSSKSDTSPLARPVPIFDYMAPESSSPPVTSSHPPLQVYIHRPRPPLPDSSLDPGSSMSSTPLVSTPPPPTSRYPSHVRRPPSQFGWLYSTNHPISQYVSYLGLSDSHRAFIGKIESVSIPRSVSEALQNPKWATAMQVEMDVLQANQTWELVPLPSDEKTVGCKWVFTVKYLADGSVDWYKACLVAKGFTQVQGKYFGATFAPVAKFTCVRLLVSLVASHSWHLHQLDVKNVFLHEDLLETIYMDHPPGFRAKGEYAGKVCCLRKSLYGLKQSPRAWFSRFSDVILSMEFIRCHSDHTCFIRRRPNGCCIILLVYVDDIILTGDDTQGIAHVKQDLGKIFDVKDLGPLKYFLGIEVARSRHGISLKESTLWTSFKILFMHAPRTAHMDAVHHILRYLKRSLSLGLFYPAGHQSGLSCFTDANYAGSQTDRRSTTGLSTFYGNHLISWRSKKQAVVSRSSAEVEYRAMAQGTCEILWIRSILNELGFTEKGSSQLFCDNKSAIMLALDSVLHERSKHIEVDIHFIREKVQSDIIIPSFVPSLEQTADLFTKPVGPSLLQSSIVKLGLIDIFAPA